MAKYLLFAFFPYVLLSLFISWHMLFTGARGFRGALRQRKVDKREIERLRLGMLGLRQPSPGFPRPSNRPMDDLSGEEIAAVARQVFGRQED